MLAPLHVFGLSQEITIPLGDFDLDLDVDGADLLAIQRGLGTTTTAADLTTWRNNFGAGGSFAAATPLLAAVPEPATGLLACVTLALAWRRRRCSAK